MSMYDKSMCKDLEAFLSGELQEFLQSALERHILLGPAVGDHACASLRTQPNARPLLSDSLQPRLGDVPAEVHPHFHQTDAMSHHSIKYAVSDADAVLQVEVVQPPAVLQHRDHILVSDVCAARQG